MKGKVAFSSHIEDLCHQIDKLTKSLKQVMAANEKITSELVIVKKININPDSRIIDFENLEAKTV